MTVREVYDYLLSEINKEETSTLLLETFNYLFGKAINEVCNAWYNEYEQTQLLTDNLRVLSRSTILNRANLTTGNFYQLPVDYWHLLPSVGVNFQRTDGLNPCNPTQTPVIVPTIQKPGIKLTSQLNSGIVRDYYTKPSYKRPYYFLHEHQEIAGNVVTTYGLEIRSGDTTLYTPTSVVIDYLKVFKIPNYSLKIVQETAEAVPLALRTREDLRDLYLTDHELNSDTDISTVMEFPNNFCYEIINKLTALVLEHNGDPRLGNNIPINQSMTRPAPK